MTAAPGPYLYVASDLGAVSRFSDAGLARARERHRISLSPPQPVDCLDVWAELDGTAGLAGVVLELMTGWPDAQQLQWSRRVVARGIPLWMHWPHEHAVERVDAIRLKSYQHHQWLERVFRLQRQAGRLVGKARSLRDAALADHYLAEIRRLQLAAAPVPFANLTSPPTADSRLAAAGLYLRTDFWVEITSGGSYGHTCYVARELSAVTERFTCLMANRFPLLDDLGVSQVAMAAPEVSSDEGRLLRANDHYRPLVDRACAEDPPAYIYERLCLGNYVGAQVSQARGIPYIVEYNGSEISMARSFGGGPLLYEDVFIEAEMAAFKQATLISVVSDAVRESLISRGIAAAKIVVNPNGADPDVYRPPTPAEKHQVRTELGLADDDRVVGFSGTFGGWHGIDVLAHALPAICARAPNARFLLIGDGEHKAVIDRAVVASQLDDRVRSVGRVSQDEGARLLAACDIFVAPHSAHMTDGRFFGSPTKLFEYMAMGGGIAASTLEQLAQVLSPALSADTLSGVDAVPPLTRGILCTPGDAKEFEDAVVFLVERPAWCQAMGANARDAIQTTYSWRRHVERLWSWLAARAGTPQETSSRLETGDAYKDEVQRQWNNSPVGSHYAKASAPKSIEWFQEIERHRYDVYAPWMPEVMEFDRHAGHDVLEIGGGLGTDLSQFARHGARVTDLDLSEGHLELARRNFSLRGLDGRFVHHDAEQLPFEDGSFDLVYTNGVLHHTPDTHGAIHEIARVLRPGGRAIVMMYAEHSIHYWRWLAWEFGLKAGLSRTMSMGEIMSRVVEISDTGARPLVKAYTAERLRQMCGEFGSVEIFKRQLTFSEIPNRLKWIPLGVAGRLFGWNLVVKAAKPVLAR